MLRMDSLMSMIIISKPWLDFFLGNDTMFFSGPTCTRYQGWLPSDFR